MKSAQMMVIDGPGLEGRRDRLPDAGGRGGAVGALHPHQIAPNYGGLVAYANDAMNGLELANQIVDPERREQLTTQLAGDTARMLKAVAARPGAEAAMVEDRPAVSQDVEIPRPPDLRLHIIRDYDLDEIFSYINPVMLYTRHLGLKNAEQALAAGEPKALELRAAIKAVEEVMLQAGDIKASAVYKFFPANSDGRRMLIYAPDGKRVLETFTFGRQSDPPRLSVADYVAPRSSGRIDYVCMLATTVGPGVRALAEEWKKQGDYLRSHILQVLALEGAEAFAELLHLKIREMWGFKDPEGLTKKDLFQAHYHGKRFSFGYPACPRLEDQAGLFRLLDLNNSSGIRLTEGFMMEPEGSVTAIVFHHPEAKYFALSAADIERLERELDPDQSSGQRLNRYPGNSPRRQTDLCPDRLRRGGHRLSGPATLLFSL